uniref:ATP synthase complex subunit 8 n=1 Tax=Lovettia sealii TaxID=1120762 RepID=A0A4Y6A485_LOVSE|nr:ATP synthase F0 subunit 8 [Lovettia sealii]QDE53114.1 ATPase subunit 8 [Lovettia sealii]
MPQLDPAPWFFMFIFSWLVFLIMIPPKVLNFVFPNEPSTQSTEKPKPTTWLWPWH